MNHATMKLEKSELLALMWAVEQAVDGYVGDVELVEDAWAAHQRLQEAWKELLT